MPGDDNVINISSASVLDLKAELYKKEEEFKKQKAAAAGQAITSVAKKVTKKEGIWSRQNKGVAERATRDKVVLDEVEGSSLEASRKAMERKAKLYDKLRKHGIEDDTLAEEVLVDFDSKPRDDSSDADEGAEKKDDQSVNDPWVEYVDEFGRTRVVRKSELPEDLPSQSGFSNSSSEDEEDSRIDEEQRRWEQAALSELKSGPTHYYDTREIRTRGVGFYRFSRDEAERQTQMQALKEMRQETEGKRALRQTIKQKRKSLLDERLALIRAHKRQTRSKPADDQHSSNTSMNITDDSGKGGKSVEATSNEVVGPAMDQLVTERAVNELLSNIRRKVESGM
ncbi:5534_t:CDS:2 [Paraglomus brasilianum]|uniref:5534_t:CDS:1 n=1 Tax=Paraglomus brasilianum TaxID=144538 RepID=A0A9N9C6T7_9GLOM|nr:5534_t:CDS:2 [Paraglomus brasilianum]